MFRPCSSADKDSRRLLRLSLLGAALILLSALAVCFSILKVSPDSNASNATERKAAETSIETGAFQLESRHPANTLSGETAREHLQKEGRFDSLVAALQAARYAAEKIDPSTPHSRGAEFFVSNPTHHLRAWFRNDGVELASGRSVKIGGRDQAPQVETPWSVGLRLKSSGRTGSTVAKGLRRLQATANRVEARDDAGFLTEWYENKKEGLEHGFTFTEAPREGEGPLEIVMAVDGNLRPETAPDEQASGVRFVKADGTEILRYSKLLAWDTTGRKLPARMEVRDSTDVALLIDDTGAAYPVTVDPLFANVEARLTEDLEGAGDNFGWSVALNNDTALVGIPNDDSASGSNVGSSYVFVRNGSTWLQQAKLFASDGAANDHFGTAIALSGDTALVGAPNDGSETAAKVGSAYVFVRNGNAWLQQAKLVANDGVANDLFGTSVALSEDTALVGAPNHGTATAAGAGSAYVFVRSGSNWGRPARLFASDGAASDNFGTAVAIYKDTALIGAPKDDTTAGANAGSAYVFTRTNGNWTELKKLTASNATSNDFFGSAVALDGGTALVGAQEADTRIADYAGTVYVFTRNESTWIEQASLIAEDGDIGDYFGFSVALSGDTALIGAPQNFATELSSSTAAGKAYLFVRNGTAWSEQTRLAASDGAAYDFFGSSVALSGNTALIAARGDDSATEVYAGSAYLVVRSGTTWSPQAKLTARDETNRDSFGSSVALNGTTALVGAPYDDTSSGINAGSVYVFTRQGSLWNFEAKITADDGASDDRFGYSVALSGDTALVGADCIDIGTATNAGGAYVFVRSTTNWTQQAKLTAAASVQFASFGVSVALDGDTALIGAIADTDASGQDTGSAHVFVRSGTTWLPQARLLGIGGAAEDNFGFSVALHGDTALIGSPQDDTSAGADAGSAYVFVRNGASWIQHARLVSRDAGSKDGFGYSVALSGDTALIGAPYNTTAAGGNAGSAYVFVRKTDGVSWGQQGKLTASDGVAFDAFGVSVALSDDTAIVGSLYGNTPAGVSTGSAYLFARSSGSWTQQTKLTSGIDSSKSDFFGHSVALDRNFALVAAYADDSAGYDAGSVYAFAIGELPQITSQPQSRTVVPGTSVTFSVTATGYAPLRYQWRRNGLEIAGANGMTSASNTSLSATYTIPSVKEGDAASYDVVISNAGGTATSAAAALGVNALSEFERASPAAVPEANGFLTVRLSPPDIGAAWRFVGEQQWRPSSVPVGGLPASVREIEFRPVPGYLHPLRVLADISGNGASAEIEREYYRSNDEATGNLSVFLKPESLASTNLPSSGRAQWRLLGEDDSKWRNSGEAVTGLVAGIYLIESKPLPGRRTPAAVMVRVVADTTATAEIAYFLADSPGGSTPELIPFETVTSGEDLPYSFVGQLRSEAGSATGFVVSQQVVATAAHVVFSDTKFSAVPGLQWLFQRDSNSYEPTPQTPRGFYTFSGYSAQRQKEATPGESAPESQNLDAAAVYFVGKDSGPGRGGYSGYLASDSPENEWLLSQRAKTLVGYPLDGIAPANRGRMHATAPVNVSFFKAFGQTYTTREITGRGGNSGGPLCVQYDDGKYYPAAIYLGGTAQTVVRAIDSAVIELFKRAEETANSGTNHTDTGYTQTDAPAGASALPFATIKVQLSPAGAEEAGARWMLEGGTKARESGTQLSSLSPGTYTVRFLPASGFAAPPPLKVILKANVITTVQGAYTPPPIITSADQKHGTRGQFLQHEIQTSGPAMSIELGGTLPDGLAFDSARGLISGIPLSSGRFQVFVRTANAAGNDSQILTIQIFPALENQVAVVGRGQEFEYKIEVSDVISSFAVVPLSLPAGLTFDSLSGVLRGTPTVSGEFKIPIQATNEGGTASAVLTLRVREGGANDLSGSVGQTFAPFSVPSPYLNAVFTSDSLPPGLTIDPDTGAISGTPTTSGKFASTVTIANGSTTGTISLNFVIDAVLRVTVHGHGQIPSQFHGQSLQSPGEVLSITARPAPGSFFVGWTWTGGESSPNPTLEFEMRDGLELQANFASFAEIRGSYTGLLFSDPADASTTGYMRVTASRTGAITGSLILGGKTYTLPPGKFLRSARSKTQFVRKGDSAITADLRFEPAANPAQLTGTIRVANVDLAVTLRLSAFDAKTRPAPQQGNYTLILPPPVDSQAPQGFGYAHVKVSSSGAVRLAGSLGDGTVISQSAMVTEHGTWGLYTSFAKGKGVAAGEITFRDRAASDLDGTLNWIIPHAGKVIGAAQKWEVDAIGSRYNFATVPIDYSHTTITFAGGALISPVGPLELIITPESKFLSTAGRPQLSLKLTSDSGLLHGNLVLPGAVTPTRFRGALFQKSRSGAGLLIGNGGKAGSVRMEPAQ